MNSPSPGRNDPRQRAAFMEALSLAQRRIRTLFDARVRLEGMTLSRARVLMILDDRARLNQRELADILGIEGPTLARILDGLEKGGWLSRMVSPSDRRVRELALTGPGQRAAARMRDIAGATRAEVLGDVSAADLEAATRVLRAVAAISSSVHTAEKAGEDGDRNE